MHPCLRPLFALAVLLILASPPTAAQCTAADFGYEGAISGGMDSLEAWLAAAIGNDCCAPYPKLDRGKGYVQLSDAQRAPFRKPKILRQVELTAERRQYLAQILAERGQGVQLPTIFSLLDIPGLLSGPAAGAKAGLSGLLALMNSLTETERLSIVQLSGVIKASSGWLQYVAWVWPGEERLSKGYFFSRRDGERWQHFYLGGVNFMLCD